MTQPAIEATITVGVGLLALTMFIMYFGADEERRKRLWGTLLSAVMVATSLYFITYKEMKKGIDIGGGASFVVKIDSKDKEITRNSAELVKSVLEKRLNPLGAQDISITLLNDGRDGLSVEIPGKKAEDIQKIRTTIEKAAKLDFRLVNDNSANLVSSRDTDETQFKLVEDNLVMLPYEEINADDKKPAAAPPAEVQDKALSTEEAETKRREKLIADGKAMVVSAQPLMAGKSVDSAEAFSPNGSANWGISIVLKDGAKASGEDYGNQMFDITTQNTGRRMAIVVDDEVISAPQIQGAFGSRFQITGSFTQTEAINLANVLKNPLENKLIVDSFNEIDSRLGADAVRNGLRAGVAGLILMLIFMAIYYRIAGIVAVIGLVVNLLMLMAVMNLFGFTMTMPGVAGIILTLGVAVDANVLIYERMREEFAAGKNFGSALQGSYEKAFSAIFDANITGLITSVLMILLATGAVQGFGVTLSIGIITSLFSALIITRILFGWLKGGGLQKLSFLSVISNRMIDFMGKRKLWATVSTVLVLGSLALFAIKRENALSYELRGGDRMVLLNPPVTPEQIRASLDKISTIKDSAGNERSFRYALQTQRPVGGEPSVIITTTKDCAKPALELVKTDLGNDTLTAAAASAKGPELAADDLWKSGLAIFLGFVGIFIYLVFRYELPFAIGGLVAIIHDVVIAAGVCMACGKEIGLTLIGAFLTIAGYSINDTIVIFDRIRESLRTSNAPLMTIMNQAISATLSRTLITSGVTGLVVVTMLFFGGEALSDFSFCMLIGMIVGTYSTIFIASPVVLWWAEKHKLNLRKVIMDADAEKLVALSGVEREVPTKDSPSIKPA